MRPLLYICGPYTGMDSEETNNNISVAREYACLLYTSDAADDLLCVDLGGRRIIKKKKIRKLTIHKHTKNALYHVTT